MERKYVEAAKRVVSIGLRMAGGFAERGSDKPLYTEGAKARVLEDDPSLDRPNLEITINAISRQVCKARLFPKVIELAKKRYRR